MQRYQSLNRERSPHQYLNDHDHYGMERSSSRQLSEREDLSSDDEADGSSSDRHSQRPSQRNKRPSFGSGAQRDRVGGHNTHDPQHREVTPRWFSARDANESGLGRFGRVPGRDDSTQRQLGRNEAENANSRHRQMGINSPTTRKPVKIQPFPENIKQADKYFKWKFWLTNFELALERSNVHGQRAKAIELSLAAGEEVVVVIMTEGLLLRTEDVGPRFPFYDHLVKGISSFFNKLTDGNMNAREFKNLKQAEGETVRDFGLRTKIAAQKIELTNDSLIAANFIDGLRDTEVRTWASAFNLSMDEVLAAATRREAETSKSFAWGGSREEATPIAIAAVNQNGPRNENRGNSHKQGNVRDRYMQHRRGMDGGRSETYERDERCPKCGRQFHRRPGCPAEMAKCHKCGKVGHFALVCKVKGVHNVRSSSEREQV